MPPLEGTRPAPDLRLAERSNIAPLETADHPAEQKPERARSAAGGANVHASHCLATSHGMTVVVASSASIRIEQIQATRATQRAENATHAHQLLCILKTLST